MGKKLKVGKQRRDKAYWAAKEIGYRSRASFKLVQLNRKWEFLQKCNVCIDLCAAPGSWMQVAKEHMPVSSLVVGVDLVPIKPIPGCIAVQGDITTDKCRSDLKKELQTAKADCVLHDGAPNVGKNWLHDAYQQSLLTLHSFKLASEFLAKGGWFVTKIFRSKDYQSLMWVFGQFFKKVHATKPAASRNESAEIFVVCQGYEAPDKIDPKFLDPKHVFSDVEDDSKRSTRDLLNPERKKKAAAEGYEDGATALYKEAKASEFIMGSNHVTILNNSNKIILDTPRILKHKKTTQEVKECCKDLKVLGMKELRLLKKWRDSLRKQFEEEDQEKKTEDSVPAIQVRTKEEEEDEELAAIDAKVDELKDEERRKARRKKKKELKEKQRRIERLNLKMIIPGDEGPTHQEEGLFKMSDMKSAKDVEEVMEQEPELVAEDSEDEEETVRPKYEKYDKEDGELHSQGLWYGEGEEHESNPEESDSEGEELGLQEEETEEVVEGDFEQQDSVNENPLLPVLEKSSIQERRAKKAQLWFDKPGLADLDEDSDVEDEEVKRAVDAVEKKGGSIKKKREKEREEEEEEEEEEEKVEVVQESGYTSGNDEDDEEKKEEKQNEEESDSDSDSDSDSEMEDAGGKKRGGKQEAGFEIVPQAKAKKRPKLSYEELALGEQLIQSKKARRDIMDGGWHRFMFDDTGLPDWFVKEEEMHMKKQLEVDPATVEKYRNKDKEINVKTIKKVVEAKARRKRKVAKRMGRAKKKAAALLENEDIGSREKATEINKLYKKAAAAGKKKDVAYVVAKKHSAAKRSKRPAGIKGPYKQVDPRLKKDTKAKRNNASGKKQQKRRLQGKQAKPTKQFNTNR